VLHAGTLLQTLAGSAGAMNAVSTLHLSIFGMGPVIHHGSEAPAWTSLAHASTVSWFVAVIRPALILRP